MPAAVMAETLAGLGGQPPPPREYMVGERLQESKQSDHYAMAGQMPNIVPTENGIFSPAMLVQILSGLLFIVILFLVGYFAFKTVIPSVEAEDRHINYTPPRMKLPGTD